MARIGLKQQGSAEDMLNVFKDTLNNISSYDINESTSITSSSYDPYYLDELKGNLLDKIQSFVDNVEINECRDSLCITIYDNGSVIDFTVPFSDLSFDIVELDSEIDYIVDTIFDEL